MEAAASLPAPIAEITVAAPVTASPPAYTASRLVSPSSSTTKPPLRLTSRPLVVFLISGFGLVPSAMMTASTSSSNSLPSTGIGLLLPLASGSPSSILMHLMAFTNPFLGSLGSSGLLNPRISTGLFSSLKSMPSSIACSTSSFLAGSSSIDLL